MSIQYVYGNLQLTQLSRKYGLSICITSWKLRHTGNFFQYKAVLFLVGPDKCIYCVSTSDACLHGPCIVKFCTIWITILFRPQNHMIFWFLMSDKISLFSSRSRVSGRRFDPRVSFFLLGKGTVSSMEKIITTEEIVSYMYMHIRLHKWSTAE